MKLIRDRLQLYIYITLKRKPCQSTHVLQRFFYLIVNNDLAERKFKIMPYLFLLLALTYIFIYIYVYVYF